MYLDAWGNKLLLHHSAERYSTYHLSAEGCLLLTPRYEKNLVHARQRSSKDRAALGDHSPQTTGSRVTVLGTRATLIHSYHRQHQHRHIFIPVNLKMETFWHRNQMIVSLVASQGSSEPPIFKRSLKKDWFWHIVFNFQWFLKVVPCNAV